MTITNENCVVGIEYEVKEAGTTEVVDSNKDSGKPLEFIMGKGQVIPGLEKALTGMSKDESGDMFIPAADAYGEYKEEAVQVVPIDQFEGIELKEGLTLYGQGEDGQTAQVMVKSFTEADVNIDFNHPMAGKDLMFSVTVKDAREATPEELQTGTVGAHEPAAGGSCGTGCGCH